MLQPNKSTILGDTAPIETANTDRAASILNNLEGFLNHVDAQAEKISDASKYIDYKEKGITYLVPLLADFSDYFYLDQDSFYNSPYYRLDSFLSESQFASLIGRPEVDLEELSFDLISDENAKQFTNIIDNFPHDSLPELLGLINTLYKGVISSFLPSFEQYRNLPNEELLYEQEKGIKELALMLVLRSLFPNMNSLGIDSYVFQLITNAEHYLDTVDLLINNSMGGSYTGMVLDRMEVQEQYEDKTDNDLYESLDSTRYLLSRTKKVLRDNGFIIPIDTLMDFLHVDTLASVKAVCESFIPYSRYPWENNLVNRMVKKHRTLNLNRGIRYPDYEWNTQAQMLSNVIKSLSPHTPDGGLYVHSMDKVYDSMKTRIDDYYEIFYRMIHLIVDYEIRGPKPQKGLELLLQVMETSAKNNRYSSLWNNMFGSLTFN